MNSVILNFHIKKFRGHAKMHKNHEIFLPQNFHGIYSTLHVKCDKLVMCISCVLRVFIIPLAYMYTKIACNSVCTCQFWSFTCIKHASTHVCLHTCVKFKLSTSILGWELCNILYKAKKLSVCTSMHLYFWHIDNSAASSTGVRRCLWLRRPKICRFMDYVVKFIIFRVTLSLQIHCLKSVGAKAPWPPWGTCLWLVVIILI